MKKKLKETSNPRQAYLSLVMVLAVSALFGFVALPMLKPAPSKLVGQPAPDFVLPVIHKGEPGSRMRLTDLRGRVVLLDFWASWCAPCRAQAPILDEFSRRHQGDDLLVLGVATGDKRGAAADFAARHSLSYPSVIDMSGAVAEAYRAKSLPTLVVVDRDGNIAVFRDRVIRKQELEELVQPVLSGT